MFKKISRFIATAEWLHWLWKFIPAPVASMITGYLGYVQDLPWMYIWLGILLAFCLLLYIQARIQTPTGLKKEKREVVLELCGKLYLMVGVNHDSNQYADLLNKAQFLFSEDEEIQRLFNDLKDKPGKNDVLIPRLLSEMGKIVDLKIDERSVERPFVGKVKGQ